MYNSSGIECDIYTLAMMFENVRRENYRRYYSEGSNYALPEILGNYFEHIFDLKININKFASIARSFAKSISEHLTGNYNIGTGEVDFEELSEYAETISSIVGYSDESELKTILREDLDGMATRNSRWSDRAWINIITTRGDCMEEIFRKFRNNKKILWKCNI